LTEANEQLEFTNRKFFMGELSTLKSYFNEIEKEIRKLEARENGDQGRHQREILSEIARIEKEAAYEEKVMELIGILEKIYKEDPNGNLNHNLEYITRVGIIEEYRHLQEFIMNGDKQDINEVFNKLNRLQTKIDKMGIKLPTIEEREKYQR